MTNPAVNQLSNRVIRVHNHLTKDTNTVTAVPTRALLIDSNKGNRHLLAAGLSTNLGIQVDVSSNLAEAKNLLEDKASELFVAVANVKLKDADNGEIVDLLNSYSIPVIAFSMDGNQSLREQIVNKFVLDYVVIKSRQHFEHIEKLVNRIRRNYTTTVLLVESSSAFRFYINDLLTNHRFKVIEAKSSEEAIGKLECHPEIKLVITESSDVGINGLELVEHIRQRYKPQSLAILGISSSDNPGISVELLKAGANDFIRKPFAIEEFYCRINQNVEILEYIEEIRNSMIRDYLTGAFNRRYLYEAGSQFYLNARRGNLSIAVAMIDADNFKVINDTYGHDIGDLVLQKIAKILQETLRMSDIVSRFGGEEFVCIINCITPDYVSQLFERVRHAIESINIETPGGVINVTVSIGVSTDLQQSLEDMINTADEAMYKAKHSGRNRVVISQPENIEPLLVSPSAY